jgi:uncharacterized protein
MAATAPTICLMLKAPRLGTVKTRLAVTHGEIEALRIYRWLVERQLRQIPSSFAATIYFSPDDAAEEMASWLNPTHRYVPQGSGDLGDRLSRAAEDAFARGANGLIFLGGDCPYVTAAHLHSLAAALQQVPVVIGPAEDGGYWSLALRQLYPPLFQNIPWSTERVLAETEKKLQALALPYTLVDRLEDVDDANSWHRARLACAEDLAS